MMAQELPPLPPSNQPAPRSPETPDRSPAALTASMPSTTARILSLTSSTGSRIPFFILRMRIWSTVIYFLAATQLRPQFHQFQRHSAGSTEHPPNLTPPSPYSAPASRITSSITSHVHRPCFGTQQLDMLSLAAHLCVYNEDQQS